MIALLYVLFRFVLIGSFSNDGFDGDGSENVTVKMNSRYLRTSSRLFQLALNVKCRRNLLELNSWRPHPNLERERKIRRRVFTSSIVKRPIRKFYVLVRCSDDKEMEQKCNYAE